MGEDMRALRAKIQREEEYNNIQQAPITPPPPACFPPRSATPFTHLHNFPLSSVLSSAATRAGSDKGGCHGSSLSMMLVKVIDHWAEPVSASTCQLSTWPCAAADFAWAGAVLSWYIGRLSHVSSLISRHIATQHPVFISRSSRADR